MPRFVDPEERRKEIIDAALKRLADKGPRSLTIRGIAKEMGKSVTSVTHYYPNRQAIIEDLNRTLDEEWLSELAELEALDQEPEEKLWTLVDWLLPVDEIAKREEKTRFALLAEDEVELIAPARDHFNDAMEKAIAESLKSFLPNEDVTQAAQMLRVFLAGIVLLAAEYPEEWAPERQRQMLSDTLKMLGLPGAPPSAPLQEPPTSDRPRAHDAGGSLQSGRSERLDTR